VNTLLLTEIFPPQTGGSGRWFYEIYRRLPRQRFAVAAGEHRDAPSFDAARDLSIHRVPLHMEQWGIANVSGLKDYWRAIRAVRSVMRQEGTAMIHCGRCLPEGVMALALRELTGARYACYVHGEDIGVASTSRELRFLVKCVFANAAYFVANSHNTARMLRSEWSLPSEHVHVLHPGVDTERFAPAERDESERARLGWHGRRVILTVGRLQLRKGQDMLIRSLPAIRQAIPDVLYAIVGDGEERQRLQRLVRQEGVEEHVQFLGEIADERLVGCYQQCDLFALPNRQIGRDIEGFGMVLLEAQACGKPVLAGNSGGTAETMDSPHTGRVVDCDSPERLAATLVDLLRDCDQLGQMGVAARAWVVEHFDWQALTAEAATLFGADPLQSRSAPMVEAVLS
jgi:phosphatidyl-myo-inositol dimannoside synthase